NTATDQAVMVVALLGVSIPNFLLGLLFVLFFSVWLGWFPVAGYSPLEYGWLKTLRSLVLPAFALGLVQSALIARIARSSMLDILREQFITAGRAKGLGERAVIYKHALKNAMIPTVTIIGISFAILISGAVVVETVFNIPGLGRLIISAVLRRDYPVIRGRHGGGVSPLPCSNGGHGGGVSPRPCSNDERHRAPARRGRAAPRPALDG